MEDNTKVLGETTKCMEKEYLFGQMAENTKVNILTIRRKVTVNSVGQTDGATKEAGKTENKTAEAPIETVKV